MATISEVYEKLNSINSEQIKVESDNPYFTQYQRILNQLYLANDNIYNNINELLILAMDNTSGFNESDVEASQIDILAEKIGKFYLDIIIKRFGRKEVLETSNSVLLDKQLQEKDLKIELQPSEKGRHTVSYKFKYEDDEKSVNITDDLKIYFKEFGDEDKIIALIPQNNFKHLDIAVLDTNRLSYIDQDIVEGILNLGETTWEKEKIKELIKLDSNGMPLYSRVKHPNETEIELNRQSEILLDKKREEIYNAADLTISKFKEDNEADVYLFNHTIDLIKEN